MKSYKVSLHIITPLIIHTGDYYSIFELLPAKDGKSVLLIDLDSAFSSMKDSDRERYYAIMDSLTSDVNKDKKNLLQARSIIQNVTFTNTDIIINRVQAHPNFIQGMDSNPYALIYKIFKDEITGKPYIPGSSLKGALRTAVLESLRYKDDQYPNTKLFKNNRPKNFQPTDFEMQIMKKDKMATFDIENDPFRFFKVSDLLLNESDVLFDTVRVIGKNSKQKGIPIYTEMTESYFTSKKDFIAQGEITIDNIGLEKFISQNKFGSFLNIETIEQSLDTFWNKILNNRKHPLNQDVKNTITELCNKNSLKPLRLGRFTQIESKTFKIKQKNPIPPDINIYGGISRSLIRGVIPAGWCGLKIYH